MLSLIKKFGLSSWISIGLLFPIAILHAQINLNVFEPSVEIVLNPEYPQPNTRVTAELTTNSFDLNTAFIGWTINNKVVRQGVGERTHTFQIGDMGQTIRLEAILQDPSTGAIIKRETVITPGSLDLIWESQGYVPPFYQGKALPVLQSMIIFTAIPQVYAQGSLVSAKDMVYTWSKNKTVLDTASGYGKDTLIIVQDFLSRPFTIDVVAKTRDERVVMEARASIDPSLPELVLYEEDPLLGLRLEKGIVDTYTLSENELRLRAIPYFGDITDRNSGLVESEWAMNGQIITSGPLEERIVLRRPENMNEGRVHMSVDIKNEGKLLQSLQDSFSILIKPLTDNSLI